MDLSLDYKLMSQKALEIQQLWEPKEGDWFILKASYCGDCSDEEPCKECLEMDNVYVISGDHYKKYFFFGAGLCNRNGGCHMDETYSAMLVADENEVNGLISKHHVSEGLWIPRQDQLQIMITNRHFSSDIYLIDWMHEVSNKYFKNSFTNTWEKLWMQIYMKFEQNKIWHDNKWININ